MEKPTTSVPPCPNSCCAMPTWKPNGGLSWRNLPHQQNLLHHHYHYHYYQCPAACSCPCNALSPPTTAQQAEAGPLQRASVYKHAHRHVPPHPHCPSHPLPSGEHTHCPPKLHTLLHPPSSDPLTEHTQSLLPPSKEYLTPTSLSAIPSASPSQASSLTTTVPYAKKPRKPQPKSKPLTPFPSPSAPPYILCQHCFNVLLLPLSPPLRLLTPAPFLKLKCSFCTRVSVFSTRCYDRMPPSADDLCQLRKSDASKDLKGDVAGDFEFKADEGSRLGLKQTSMDAHMPATCASGDGCGREQCTHEPVIDTSADREQKIIDANVLDEVIQTEIFMQDNYSSPQPSPKLNPEFAGFSSVQDWVNSIEQESFLHCPTPLLSTAFGSDLQLQESVDWEIFDEELRADMVSVPLPGSPLHEHFGYRSPSELLNKIPSSDDEIKIPSDTTSSASTSATSANTFTPPGFENVDRSKYRNRYKSVFVKQVSKSSVKDSADIEPSNQVSLANVFGRSIKGLVEGKRLSVPSPKSRVTVNGHMLSQVALKRAEERAGKLRPGTYWYDSKAGFWGIIGGPCLGVLPPYIEELQYPISRDCSNGDTQIFVNGRELHHKDLTILALRGLSKKPGMAYAIGFDGIVVEETSGQELKHLGKLAPTVERKGKGFGMYMAKQR